MKGLGEILASAPPHKVREWYQKQVAFFNLSPVHDNEIYICSKQPEIFQVIRDVEDKPSIVKCPKCGCRMVTLEERYGPPEEGAGN